MLQFLVIFFSPQIIGRVLADPDYLPRTVDFGLNADAFHKKFCVTTDCPDPFFKIAIMCCQMTADNRYKYIYKISN